MLHTCISCAGKPEFDILQVKDCFEFKGVLQVFQPYSGKVILSRFIIPPEKGGILFCNCRSVGMSVGRSVDHVLSAQYLLTTSLDQYQT